MCQAPYQALGVVPQFQPSSFSQVDPHPHPLIEMTVSATEEIKSSGSDVYVKVYRKQRVEIQTGVKWLRLVAGGELSEPERPW